MKLYFINVLKVSLLLGAACLALLLCVSLLNGAGQVPFSRITVGFLLPQIIMNAKGTRYSRLTKATVGFVVWLFLAYPNNATVWLNTRQLALLLATSLLLLRFGFGVTRQNWKEMFDWEY